MGQFKKLAACCLAYKEVAVLCCAAQNLGSDLTVELRMMNITIMTAYLLEDSGRIRCVSNLTNLWAHTHTSTLEQLVSCSATVSQ